jgi:tetratricopeptide (TPR) repeat protein
MSGDWGRARAELEGAVAVSPATGSSWFSSYPRLYLGCLCLSEGNWDAASVYLEEVRTAAERSRDLQALRQAARLQAELDVLEGRPGVAVAGLIPLRDRPGLEESDVTYFLPVLAWAHLECGELEQATEVVAQAISRARPENYRTALVDALRVQALLALQQGRWDEAHSTLEEGLELARVMPYPYMEGRLLQVYGRMHARTGEPHLARERLEAALAIFRRLGARKDIEQVEQAVAAIR